MKSYETFPTYSLHTTKHMKKYFLIIKINLIGDDYMAAICFFETEDNPEEHATQTISKLKNF